MASIFLREDGAAFGGRGVGLEPHSEFPKTDHNLDPAGPLIPSCSSKTLFLSKTNSEQTLTQRIREHRSRKLYPAISQVTHGVTEARKLR